MTSPLQQTSPTLWPSLDGYEITEQLYSGSRTAVYRAVQTNTGRSVVIKILCHEYPSFNELTQFRNQYSIAKSLNITGIVHPYSLEAYGNSYALVMEDFSAISLEDYRKQCSISLTDFLSIALQVSEILHDLHQSRVIHRDIKPANILIQPSTKVIKIIDFSIASVLPKETQEIQNPNILEGTIAYLAPEQTGRMNRGIDYRTDFYALGVTFYQLLSGRLPFEATDPLKLIHCHIAKTPTALDQVNPAIPSMVAAIVSKLMAKNAEHRYQTAKGLKHDLEQCWTQWEATQQIQPFELGTRDLSDRFLISDKLYGRDREVACLLAAFERVAQGSTELMLVAGFSGIGKTAVIHEIHKPITRQKGYFIKGKFDQFNRNIPLSAFVQAFRDLMSYLLSEPDSQLSQWRTKILEALGESGQVLIEVIPELETIIGSQAAVPELSGTAAQNRFNFLFQKFIQVFTRPDHPLVIFLDDLQWADLASLQLLKVLMGDSAHLLMLGAYRDNEVSPIHPLMVTLEELAKEQAVINTITLNPLSLEHTNDLVADTLRCPPDRALPLTQSIDRKTQGNPFFTTQFLKSLHEEGWITFNREACYWECDISSIYTLTTTDDVVEFMAARLQRLPESTRSVLKLAACLGNQFDLVTLSIIAQQSAAETANALWKALQEGLVLPNSQVYKFFQPEVLTPADREVQEPQVNPTYRFLHDRVQQAAYSLIDPAQKPMTHLTIGQLLQTQLSGSELENRRFDIINHLNLGQDLLTTDAERVSLAQSNLEAAQKAKMATAYAAASNFVSTGLSLLSNDRWQKQYHLSLELHILAAEVACLMGDIAEMDNHCQQVLTAAQTPLDKVEIYKIQINALATRNQMSEAIAIGSDALSELGVALPTQTNSTMNHQVLEALAQQLEDYVIEDLGHLSPMTNPRIMAAMKLMAALFAPIYMVKIELFPLVCARMVSLSLEFGNSSVSMIGYSGYGLILTNFYNEFEKGYQFGKVSLELLDRFSAPEYRAMTLFLFSIFIQHRHNSLRSTIPMLKESYLLGMETGNLLYAVYSINNYFFNQFFSGFCLTDIEPDMEQYCIILSQMKRENPVSYLRMQQQAFQGFVTNTDYPDRLIGQSYDETVMFPQYVQKNESSGLAFAYIYKLILAYLFDHYERAIDYINAGSPCMYIITGHIHISVFHFYAGLTYFRAATTQSSLGRSRALSLGEQQQTALAPWARQSPINHQHKADLLEAEKCRVLEKFYEAGILYDRAIDGAKAQGFLQEEALANELAAKFYLDWNKEKFAASYMQEAYYCYARWGAKAKVSDLEQHYPKLLSPILESVSEKLNPLETFVSIATATYSSTATQNSSSQNLNVMLDLAAIIRASQSIASTIQLDELLQQLTQIILQYSGGDQCILMVPDHDGEWLVRAIASTEITKLCTIPLQNENSLPLPLIQWVKNTRESVVINEGQTHLPIGDAFLDRPMPQSILCLPILNQSQLVGILYLSNQAAKNVFTSDRLLVLNFLCAQAAISLENARLYQQARTYAQQLEQSQLQIVQSEKMASLGNLVAGVAHEINNPISFLNGSIQNLQDSFQDLIGHLELYQQHYPNPESSITDNAEEIDLDFLSEDLPALLKSMQLATDRIKGISNSLRTFSRADTEYKIQANLHEGIDSTLLILKYRLKANEHRPAIEVIQDYGDIPAIDCFPGQLNQVFMNLLANAIDMFDELAQGQSFEELTAHPQVITICTRQVDDHVQITIQDNGKGMNEALQAKIFDPTFTTKAVGKGTGLGLAIARQIVVEKHGGSLTVRSELGQGSQFLMSLPIRGS